MEQVQSTKSSKTRVYEINGKKSKTINNKGVSLKLHLEMNTLVIILRL